MMIDEAFELFHDHSLLRIKFEVLKEVGFGYLALGQPGPTLSGGEAQRLKIAASLDQEARLKTNNLFILDEPPTGLHQDDVLKLLEVLHHLVDRGKSVILIRLGIRLLCDDHCVRELRGATMAFLY